MTPSRVSALVALIAVVATLPLGGRGFGMAAAVAAGIALLAVTAAVDSVGPRPVVVAAAIAGIGTPLRLALVPDDGLAAIPALATAMLLAGFVMLLIARRRSDIAGTLGATAFTGLLVGLGAGALVVLRLDRQGFRWTLAVLALCVLPNVVATAAARLKPDMAGADQAARSVALAAIAGALAAAANPPFTLAVAAGVAVICAAAGYAAGLVEQVAGAFGKDAGAPPTPSATGLGWFVPVLLAAPAVSLLATVVQS